MRTADNELEIVRFALALHLNIDPDDVTEELLLDEELGLDPLDLVLIVLRLEELGEVEFPVADLALIRTVHDLTEVVRGWCRRADAHRARAGRASTLPPPPTKPSGMHTIGDLSEEIPTSRRAG